MDNKNYNLILAIFLSVTIIFGWQFFYERPRLAEFTARQQQQKAKVIKYHHDNALKQQQIVRTAKAPINNNVTAGKITINNDALQGSINLRGARFDDLSLVRYHQTQQDNSPQVQLLSQTNPADNYFIELGWFSTDKNISLPNHQTIWRADKDNLTPGSAVNLSWHNDAGVEFTIKVALDDNYMFTITQTIHNHSNNSLPIQFYGLLNRNYKSAEKVSSVVHEGPIAVLDGKLSEYSYDKIKEDKQLIINRQSVDWLGISDKYWLNAFILDKHDLYDIKFSYTEFDIYDKYQVDFISPVQYVNSNKQLTISHRLFSGAKEDKILDRYADKYSIKLFDRAIDFGWFYILTKPMLYALSFCYNLVGNFGISILVVTILVKILMFSLSNTSYRSMRKMKELQPKIEQLKTLYGDDKLKFNQEVMALYKNEKVNPISGCLPLLVQIPVFFSLYKVLYVSIEMRHAAFFGWIQDLSAPDPTSIFNLFGLLPWDPPSLLTIGVWPILMSVSMYLQQRLSPPPTDPVQAQVMKIMPIVFLVMFSKFPAGLVIYWTWSNFLSIVQQLYIMKLEDKAKST